MEINLAYIGKFVLFFFVWWSFCMLALMAKFFDEIDEMATFLISVISLVITAAIFIWWHGYIVFVT